MTRISARSANYSSMARWGCNGHRVELERTTSGSPPELDEEGWHLWQGVYQPVKSWQDQHGFTMDGGSIVEIA